jgi:tetratricopeptide (TPR) repeat protein
MQRTARFPSPTIEAESGATRTPARDSVVTLLCAALFFSLGAPGTQAQDAAVDAWTEEHFRVAEQAQARKDLEAAAEEYRAIVARNPRFAGALLNLGIVYHQQRKYREAIKTLGNATSIEPKLLGAQLFLGIDQYMVQDLKGATVHLSDALRLKPDDRQAGMYLALTYLALDQPERAVRQLRQTSRYFPDDPEIHYYEGEAYLTGIAQSLSVLRQTSDDTALYHWALALAAEQKKDLLTAVQEDLKTLGRDPGIAGIYLKLAGDFAALEMPDLAASALDRFKQLNPERDPASYRVPQGEGSPLAGQAGALESRESLKRLWQQVPPANAAADLPAVADELVNRTLKKQVALPGAARLRESVQLYLRGNYAKASEAVRADVDRRANMWTPAYMLARCDVAEGDYAAAEKVLESSLEPYFDLPSIALLRAEIESHLSLESFAWIAEHQPDSYLGKLLQARSAAAYERDDEAIALYEEVLMLAPGRLGVHLAIGQIHERKLQWAPAIEEYKQELALAPDNAMALAHLGHAYTGSRDAPHAIETLEKLLASNPADGQAYADLGKAWTLEGNTRKAIAAYEQALRCDPGEMDVHYRLFQLYKKIGEATAAQNHLAAFKEGEARQKESYRQSMTGQEEVSKRGQN